MTGTEKGDKEIITEEDEATGMVATIEDPMAAGVTTDDQRSR